jgi:signal transduction histidine kinase/DNA-binding NarL/FixJ family response regulator/CHASE3 domain sensor protein
LDVLDHVGNISESLAHAEAGQRGYLMTRDAGFARERDQAMARVENEAVRVRELTPDNPIQQSRARNIEALVATRLALMHARSDLRDAGPSPPNSRGSGMGREMSAHMYALTQELDRAERSLLAMRRARQHDDYGHTLATIVLAVAISLAALIPSYLGFLREARGRHVAEGRLLDMANSLPGAVYRLRTLPGGQRRFEFLGQGVTTLRSVDRDSAVQHYGVMWDTIVEQDRPGVLEAMAEAERTLQSGKYDFRVKVPDGTLRWVRSSATLRKEEDGSILWNGYWADVTREKRLQQELQGAIEAANAASRAKGTFLATMSHEIRTPMNGVLGMLELLSLTQLDGEQRTTLGVIRESGRSLLRIIDDILDFSKIEAGKMEVCAEPVSVREVVDRVCDIYRGNASSKGLILKRDVDARIGPVLMVDPGRLQQVLNNFVSNAIKFTSRGEVEARADLVERREDAEVVRFTVRDTGIGIAATEQEALFAPFAQASPSIHRFGGTGLGLAICRRLAAIMGGTIAMQSEPGVGTTMTFTLAMAPADSHAMKRTPAAQEAPLDAVVVAEVVAAPALSADEARRAGKLVLLVDDHPINRLLLLKQVNALGYAGELAENGRQALDSWRLGGIGMVITDCHMPEMDGYELARAIRVDEAKRGGGPVPIIACTANALEGEAQNCFSAGMDDYLAKPVDLARLSVKLRLWMPHEPAQPSASAIAPQPPPDLAERVIDATILAEVSGGDPRLECEVLRQFRRYNGDDGRALTAAIDRRDLAEVSHVSHRMKGASKTIGATGLASACDHIERAARAGEWDGVLARMGDFDREIGALDRHLEALEATVSRHSAPQAPGSMQ